MSVTRSGHSGADDVGSADSGQPPAPVRGAQVAERQPGMSSAQKEAAVQARHGGREGAGRGKAGRAAKQEAAVMTDSVKEQYAGPGQGLDESWEDRVAKFDELEDAKLDEMLDARLDKRMMATLDEMLDARDKAWIDWYKKVGIHRDFARDYARHAARMSC